MNLPNHKHVTPGARCDVRFKSSWLCRTFLVAHERRTFTSTTSPHRKPSSPGHIDTALDFVGVSSGWEFGMAMLCFCFVPGDVKLC